MTAATVAAVKKYNSSRVKTAEDQTKTPTSDPDITDPSLGNPISHGQIVDISRFLKEHFPDEAHKNGYFLDQLLRGSKIYIAPPEPKRETTPEYKALMERLRREEEDRQYERMLTSTDALNQKPSLKASAFNKQDKEADEMTYADVNRQVALIINVLVSIIACSIAIWLVASGWSAPIRLALSLGGSIAVAVAEVGVYLGYLQRLQTAKKQERRRPEKKEISNTWVIESQALKSPQALREAPTSAVEELNLRRRKV